MCERNAHKHTLPKNMLALFFTTLLHSSPFYKHISLCDFMGTFKVSPPPQSFALRYHSPLLKRGSRRETMRRTQRSLCFAHEQSTFELETGVKGSAVPHREQNIGKTKEDGNLTALSSCSPLLYNPLMLLYICFFLLPVFLCLSAPQMLLCVM